MIANNFGLVVEQELITDLNNIRYKDLSNNMKALIRDLYGPVGRFEKIKASV